MEPNDQAVNSHQVTAQEKRQDLDTVLTELRNEPALGAMSVLPIHSEFETKDKEEQVVLLLRQHIVTNLKWAVITLLLAFVPLVVAVLPIAPESLSARYQVLVSLVWELLIFGYAMEKFLIWFFNVYIITNERVVDIDFHNLLNREISDADLDKIQDVTIRGSGVAAAFFHYGDILVQTAGERQEFEFHSVPQPERVARVLRSLIEYTELQNRQPAQT